MNENIFKSMQLKNNLELNIYDKSRKIATDTWIVKLIIRVEIRIEDSIFTDISELPFGIDEIKDKLGEKVYYEVKIERNFVDDSEKEIVFNSLFESFKTTNLPYISKKIFPGKYVIKKYREN